MSQIEPSYRQLDDAYRRIKAILTEARGRAWQAVNAVMVAAYWEVGRVIVEVEQGGQERADYGKQVIDALARRIKADFGKGFDRSNLFHMKAFYLAYPIVDALRRELSWTHYRLLLRVDKPEARSFYEAEAVNARWSTRELERQIHSMLFERLALSRDQAGLMALAQKGHEIHEPGDLVKDPYVLEFALPEGNTQIFASRYKLYLPTEEELAAELQRERQVIELTQNLTEGREP